MESLEYVHATEVLLVDWQQRIALLGVRKPRPGKPFAHKIMGAGGKRMAKETLYECAVREVQEELGVTPLGLRNIGTLETFRHELKRWYMVHLYVSLGWSDMPRPSNELEPIFVPLDGPYPSAVPLEEKIMLEALARDERRSLRIAVFDQHDGSTEVSHYLE